MNRFLTYIIALITIGLANVHTYGSGITNELVLGLLSKEIISSNTIAIRENVPVRLINIGESNPSNIVLRITDNDGLTYAITDGFEDGSTITLGDDTYKTAKGYIDLNTDEFVSYYSNAPPFYSANFVLSLWDVGLNRLLVSDKIRIQNNPYHPGMPGPSPINVDYVVFSSNSAPPQVGWIIQYIGGGEWAAFAPTNILAAGGAAVWGLITGSLADQTDLWTHLGTLASSNWVEGIVSPKADSNLVYNILATKLDSNTAYSAFALAADVTGLGTDETARAWAVAGSNLAAQAASDLAGKLDSNTAYSAFALAADIIGLGTDGTARAWAVAGSNLAAQAATDLAGKLDSNTAYSAFALAADIIGLGTDETARAWAVAGSNLAAQAASDLAGKLDSNTAYAAFALAASAAILGNEASFSGLTVGPRGVFGAPDVALDSSYMRRLAWHDGVLHIVSSNSASSLQFLIDDAGKVTIGIADYPGPGAYTTNPITFANPLRVRNTMGDDVLTIDPDANPVFKIGPDSFHVSPEGNISQSPSNSATLGVTVVVSINASGLTGAIPAAVISNSGLGDSNFVAMVLSSLPGKLDSNTAYSAFALAADIIGLGTDETARAWAVAGSNLAAQAASDLAGKLDSNTAYSAFALAEDVTGLGTDETARAWAVAGSNLAAQAASDLAGKLDSNTAYAAFGTPWYSVTGRQDVVLGLVGSTAYAGATVGHVDFYNYLTPLNAEVSASLTANAGGTLFMQDSILSYYDGSSVRSIYHSGNLSPSLYRTISAETSYNTNNTKSYKWTSMTASQVLQYGSVNIVGPTQLVVGIDYPTGTNKLWINGVLNAQP